MSKLFFYFIGDSFGVCIRIRHYANRFVAATCANFKTTDRSFIHTAVDYNSLPIITDIFPAIWAYCRIVKLHRFSPPLLESESRYSKTCWRAASELSPHYTPAA